MDEFDEDGNLKYTLFPQIGADDNESNVKRPNRFRNTQKVLTFIKFQADNNW